MRHLPRRCGHSDIDPLPPLERRALLCEDADELAEALGLLIEDARLRAALGASGRRYVEENYCWNVVLEK
jgi:glycosyltransferase involved in cell wall biosynthesis